MLKSPTVKCRALPTLRSDTIHIIKRKSNPLSYTEEYFNRHKHYVIGFANIIMARKVQYTICAEPSIRMYRRDFDDITEEINAGLQMLGVPKVSGSVTLDTRALLHIPKQDENLPEAMNDGMFHLSTVSLQDFLMFPFYNNMGIIMPYDIVKEDKNEIVIMSNVVESSESINQFRDSLNRSNQF